MKHIQEIVIIILSLSLTGCLQEKPNASEPLELVDAYAVDTQFPVELSGLAIFEGQLYTVADKVDTVLFRIEIEADRAELKAARSFRTPEDGSMDWEGVTVDQEGNFYLVSEAKSRIAKLALGSDQAEWITPDLSESVDAELGLFSKSNAGFEGITWVSRGHFLLAVEREPRGLVEFRKVNDQEWVSAYRLNITRFGSELSLFRLADFSGLTYVEGRLWGLFRNGHLITPLEIGEQGYEESGLAYSYAAVENDPLYQYRDKRFGQAEGLAMDNENFYIVMDNNLSPRQIDVSDNRPQLFILKRPESSY